VEKLKVAASLRAGGGKVLNADDTLLGERGENVMTFGLKVGQVKARELRPDGLGTRFVLEAQGERVSTRLNLIGNHNVLNALAAVSTGLTLGIPLRKLAERLKSFISQAPMRMEIKNVKGVLFINDAYNASPTSMEAALVTFEDLQGSKRKLAVLGDMLELGSFSKETHARVVRRAIAGSLEGIVLVGPKMGEAFKGLAQQTKTNVWAFSRVSHARIFLKSWAERGDAVLLKASRGMRLEKVLEGF
jgi:UDP-N-acetylmuramoyl-tripeptide--D-alanyl-D-alanine ligase